MDILPIRTADRPAEPPSTRLAGLDVLRAGAALGVVALHAGVPYLQNPMPGLTWAVKDDSSRVVDFGFWWIELFIMPLFLVIAGYLAIQTLQRKGPATLIRNRASRLLIPLLFGVLVILPIDLHLWVLGWVSEGLVPMSKLRSFKFDDGLDRHLWGLSHLWFLQYLFTYVAVTAAGFWVLQRRPSPRLARWADVIKRNPLATMLTLAAMATITLTVSPNVVWGFQHHFLPVPSKWLYSGLFFALGAGMAVHDPELTRPKAMASRLVVPAVVVSVLAVWIGQWHLSAESSALATHPLAGLVLAAITVAAATLLTLAMLGASVSIVKTSTVFSYLAAASFWIYLVHHPVLSLIHIDLKWLLPSLSPLAKAILSFAGATSVSLLSYEGLVRKTRLGRWLGFQWRPGVPKSPSVDSTEKSRRITVRPRHHAA